MRIPRCAQPWLMDIAGNLVQAGCESPESTHYTWIESWRVALYWKHTRTYSALAFIAEKPVDSSQKTQIMDAFARCCKRKLVNIAKQTPGSGICFFGGVPMNVPMCTPDYDRMRVLH